MIGSILITLALIASVFSVIMYYLTFKGFTNTLKFARIGFHTASISVIAASALLLHAILTHQYQFKYIFNYSNSDLPIGLLISTFYAGQEGSFMLWILFSVIVGLILLEYTSKRGDLEQRVMMIFSLALAFLLVMVSPGLKNPFAYIWSEPNFIELTKINQAYLSLPFLQNFLFSDPGTNKTFVQINADLAGLLASNGISLNNFIVFGKGLNPLLQNFWMQIHPPALFVGFAMAIVPFAFAFSALLKNDYRDWVKQAFPWVLATAMILGAAIMLGGYWAYGVLGWGGYWGWDPVENSSLVPWIIGVASIHTILVQMKTQSEGKAGRYVKTNLILCITTFLFVLYSTFLTRSGVLGDASVHSFVDPGMTVYLLLVVFIGSFALLGIGGIAYRWKYLEQTFAGEDNLLSRELALFTGSIALLASAIIILAGTSAPIFGRSVELSFYNELNLPIAIIMGLLNGFSLILKWKVNDSHSMWNNLKLSLLITIILSLLIIVLGSVYNVMLTLLTISAVFTLVTNLEIAFKLFNGRISKLGAYLAHAGIALFMLGVVATGGFTSNQHAELVMDKPVEVLGHELTFKGYTPVDGGRKYAFNVEVTKGSSTAVVSPVMFISDFNNSLMREPDIWNRITNDFYISPVSFQEGGTTSDHNHSHGTSVTLTKGESSKFNNAKIIFDSFNFPPESMTAMQAGGEFFIGAKLIVEFDGAKYSLEPRMTVQDGKKQFHGASLEAANLKIEMTNLDASGTVVLSFDTLDHTDEPAVNTENKSDVFTIEASVKPFINLVWAGVIVMVIGFVFSIVRRTKESQ